MSQSQSVTIENTTDIGKESRSNGGSSFFFPATLSQKSCQGSGSSLVLNPSTQYKVSLMDGLYLDHAFTVMESPIHTQPSGRPKIYATRRPTDAPDRDTVQDAKDPFISRVRARCPRSTPLVWHSSRARTVSW